MAVQAGTCLPFAALLSRGVLLSRFERSAAPKGNPTFRLGHARRNSD